MGSNGEGPRVSFADSSLPSNRNLDEVAHRSTADRSDKELGHTSLPVFFDEVTAVWLDDSDATLATRRGKHKAFRLDTTRFGERVSIAACPASNCAEEGREPPGGGDGLLAKARERKGVPRKTQLDDERVSATLGRIRNRLDGTDSEGDLPRARQYPGEGFFSDDEASFSSSYDEDDCSSTTSLDTIDTAETQDNINASAVGEPKLLPGFPRLFNDLAFEAKEFFQDLPSVYNAIFVKEQAEEVETDKKLAKLRQLHNSTSWENKFF